MVLDKIWCAGTSYKSTGTFHTNVLKSAIFAPIFTPILGWITVSTYVAFEPIKWWLVHLYLLYLHLTYVLTHYITYLSTHYIPYIHTFRSTYTIRIRRIGKSWIKILTVGRLSKVSILICNDLSSSSNYSKYGTQCSGDKNKTIGIYFTSKNFA